jgi:hypothetical protein
MSTVFSQSIFIKMISVYLFRTFTGFCEIGPEDRVACGLVNHNPSDDFDGTPQEACERRGCCYNNETYDVKWCFHPSSK